MRAKHIFYGWNYKEKYLATFTKKEDLEDWCKVSHRRREVLGKDLHRLIHKDEYYIRQIVKQNLDKFIGEDDDPEYDAFVKSRLGSKRVNSQIDFLDNKRFWFPKGVK